MHGLTWYILHYKHDVNVMQIIIVSKRIVENRRQQEKLTRPMPIPENMIYEINRDSFNSYWIHIHALLSPR
jgi:hypothetical protein